MTADPLGLLSSQHQRIWHLPPPPDAWLSPNACHAPRFLLAVAAKLAVFPWNARVRSFLFRIIGVLEIAGGFYGMVLMFRRLFPLGSTQDAILSLLGLLIYGFVLVAGVLLMENSERGVSLSRVAQLMQLPLIATPIFSYALHCGAFLNIFATVSMSPHLGLDWHVGSQGFVLALGGPSVSRVGVNLLALFSWLILRFR